MAFLFIPIVYIYNMKDIKIDITQGGKYQMCIEAKKADDPNFTDKQAIEYLCELLEYRDLSIQKLVAQYEPCDGVHIDITSLSE